MSAKKLTFTLGGRLSSGITALLSGALIYSLIFRGRNHASVIHDNGRVGSCITLLSELAAGEYSMVVLMLLWVKNFHSIGALAIFDFSVPENCSDPEIVVFAAVPSLMTAVSGEKRTKSLSPGCITRPHRCLNSRSNSSVLVSI